MLLGGTGTHRSSHTSMAMHASPWSTSRSVPQGTRWPATVTSCRVSPGMRALVNQRFS